MRTFFQLFDCTSAHYMLYYKHSATAFSLFGCQNIQQKLFYVAGGLIAFAFLISAISHLFTNLNIAGRKEGDTIMTPEEKRKDVEQDAKNHKSLIYRFWENAVAKKKDLHLLEDAPEEDSPAPARNDHLPDEDENDIQEAPAPKEETTAAPVSPNQMEEKYLEALRVGRSIRELDVVMPGRYSDFMLDDSVPNDDQRNFFNRLQGLAKSYLETQQKEQDDHWKALEEAQKEAEKAAQSSDPNAAEPPKVKEPDPPAKIDASVEIKMSPTRMEAWLFLFPPRNGGSPLGYDQLSAMVKDAGVTTNLDEDALRRLADRPEYLRLAVIAQGTPPVDGQDGYIEELFPRDNTFVIKEKDNNTVDYKDLNWLHQVEKGGTICKIFPPVPGVDGLRVTGEAAKARMGKDAFVPKGKNTSINEERTALIADIDGEVTFKNNAFQVEQILVISGDIDNSTGNLEFIGDIIVNGDVRNGFTIKATGNITIKGMAESAQIVSGGNIQVGAGMNGNSRGCLEAKGDIKCKYLENCTVNAGGSVYSDSIVHCTVYSNDKVQVISGVGSIIGGSVTASNEIAANIVGNKSNRSTVLVLGNTPDILKEKIELEKTLKKLDEDLEEAAKGLSYLKSVKTLTPQQKKLSGEWKLKTPLMQMQKTKAEKRLEEINDAGLALKNCRIHCGTIYPPTQIYIGRSSMTVQVKEVKCSIYYLDGEIHVARNQA